MAKNQVNIGCGISSNQLRDRGIYACSLEDREDIGVGTEIEIAENESFEIMEVSCDDPAGCLVALELNTHSNDFVRFDTDKMRDLLEIKLGSFTVGAIFVDVEFGMYYEDGIAPRSCAGALTSRLR